MSQGGDILQSDFYLYCRNYLSVFGVWPLQNPKIQYFLRVANFIAVFSAIIPHVVKAFELRHNLTYFLLCVPSLTFYIQYVTKFLHLIAKNHKCKELIDCIKHDFQSFKGEQLEILYQYANQAKRVNKIYASYFYSVVVLYNLSAFVPLLLDVLHPLNETRHRPMPRLMKYNIKRLEDNFFVISLHGFFFNLLGITLIIGFDTLLLNCTQHACALFQIVTKLPAEIKARIQWMTIVHVIICIRNSYTDLLESTYAVANLLVIAITLGSITLAEFQTVQHKGQTEIMFRFGVFMGGELFHIFCHNYPSQRILNHSLAVYTSGYSCEWYREDVSSEFKKLLNLIILRSQRPSYLTGGGLYILGLENFATILKASLSYFAFLSSF